jgi:hypothetical protein
MHDQSQTDRLSRLEVLVTLRRQPPADHETMRKAGRPIHVSDDQHLTVPVWIGPEELAHYVINALNEDEHVCRHGGYISASRTGSAYSECLQISQRTQALAKGQHLEKYPFPESHQLIQHAAKLSHEIATIKADNPTSGERAYVTFRRAQQITGIPRGTIHKYANGRLGKNWDGPDLVLSNDGRKLTLNSLLAWATHFNMRKDLKNQRQEPDAEVRAKMRKEGVDPDD